MLIIRNLNRISVQSWTYLTKAVIRSSSLTARPWAEHGSYSARGLFLVLVGDQCQTSAQPETTFVIYTPKTAATLIHGKRSGCFSLLDVKYNFLGLSKRCI